MSNVNVNDQLVNIAQIVRRCPTATLRRAYVHAMQQWCRETQWLRLAVPGATVIGNQVYSLGSDPYLDIVGVRAMQGSYNPGNGPQYWPIYPSDPTSWDPNSPPGQPTRFAYVPEGQFALNLIPDAVYPLLVTVIAQPKDGAVQVPAAPLVKYSSVFEAGALAYLMVLPDQPWTNPIEAAKQAREFRSGVSNGKTEVQREFNTGSLRVRPRGFVR